MIKITRPKGCAKPTCHSKCTNGCQKHFIQMENEASFLRKEVCKWWGAAVTKGARDSLLSHDILMNAQRVEGGGTKLGGLSEKKKFVVTFI